MMAKATNKPKVGDYYWFHGAFEPYLRYKAVVVKRVTKGYECLLEIVTEGDMDEAYNVGRVFKIDVRHMWDAEQIKTSSDPSLFEVVEVKATPVVAKRDGAAKWKQRFEYLLRAPHTEQTFLSSHKNLDLAVKEIDGLIKECS